MLSDTTGRFERDRPRQIKVIFLRDSRRESLSIIVSASVPLKAIKYPERLMMSEKAGLFCAPLVPLPTCNFDRGGLVRLFILTNEFQGEEHLSLTYALFYWDTVRTNRTLFIQTNRKNNKKHWINEWPIRVVLANIYLNVLLICTFCLVWLNTCIKNWVCLTLSSSLNSLGCITYIVYTEYHCCGLIVAHMCFYLRLTCN